MVFKGKHSVVLTDFDKDWHINTISSNKSSKEISLLSVIFYKKTETMRNKRKQKMIIMHIQKCSSKQIYKKKKKKKLNKNNA